jgi:hypothetical protein
VPHGLDRGVELLQRGDDDDFHVRVVFLDDLENLEAADAGQADVEHHQVDVLFLHDLQRSFARSRLQYTEVAPQDGRQRIAHSFVIVDYQNGFAALGHWRRSITRLLDTSEFPSIT